jgi:tetratricopeptide (TPR) repeat protein/predicted Ser/Thr protein kinase
MGQVVVAKGWMKLDSFHATLDRYKAGGGNEGDPDALAEFMVNEGLLTHAQIWDLQEIMQGSPGEPMQSPPGESIQGPPGEPMQGPPGAPMQDPTYPCPGCGTPIPLRTLWGEDPADPRCPNCDKVLQKPDGLAEFAEAADLDGVTAAPPGTVSPPEAKRTLASPEDQEEEISLVGEIVGNCRVIEQIGEGGMGVVYRAHHILLNRQVALKVLPRSLDLSKSKVQRFMQEAGALGTLTSPNIVQVFSVGEERGNHFIEMEYVGGGSLDDRLQPDEPMPLENALPIMRAILDGLVAAHEKEIIHRDIKPGNILITKDGVYKIADFGLAKSLQSDSHHTREGAMMGTPQHMSPEQCRGKEVDKRSDVYSLGTVFYQILTGALPFESEDPLVVVLKQMNEEVQSPRRLAPELPLSYSNLIERMMAKDPDERFQDSAEVLAAIDDIEKGIELVYTARRIRRRRFRIALAVVIFLLLSAGSVVGIHAFLQLQKEREKMAAETPERQATALFNKAKARFESKDFKGAIPVLREALETWDGIAEAEGLLGRAETLYGAQTSLDGGRVDEADRLLLGYKRDLGVDAVFTSVRKQVDLFRGALQSFEAERWAEGIGRIDAFVKSNPSNEHARRLKMILEGLRVAARRTEEGESVEALASLQGLLPSSGAYPRVSQWHGQLLQELDAEIAALIMDRRLVEARALCNRVLAIVESPAVLRRKQDVEDFLVGYRRILGEAERKFGEYDFDGALTAFRRAKRITTSPELEARIQETSFKLAVTRGLNAQRARNYDEAYDAFEAARRYRSERAAVDSLIVTCRREEALHLIGSAAAVARLGDVETAKAVLEVALEVWPDEETPPAALEVSREIQRWESMPSGTRYVPGGTYPVGPGDGLVEVAPFYMDVEEVTNGAYKAFIDAGGYEKEEYWDPEGWTRRKAFRDRTGEHYGPQHWIHGTYPSGAAELPVNFISWYEARAYARWRGGRLPGRNEWMVAASWSPVEGKRLTYPWGNAWKADAANVGTLDGETPLKKPGSFHEDRSPMGFLDMAGNVSEWTATPAPLKKGRYFVKGGSNHHATAGRVELNNDLLTAPPDLRLEIIGLRLAHSVEKDSDSNGGGK